MSLPGMKALQGMGGSGLYLTFQERMRPPATSRRLGPMEPCGCSGSLRPEVAQAMVDYQGRGAERLSKAIHKGDLRLSDSCEELAKLLGVFEALRPKASPHTKQGTGTSGTNHDKRNANVATKFKKDVLKVANKRMGSNFEDCTKALKYFNKHFKNKSPGSSEESKESEETPSPSTSRQLAPITLYTKSTREDKQKAKLTRNQMREQFINDCLAQLGRSPKAEDIKHCMEQWEALIRKQ